MYEEGEKDCLGIQHVLGIFLLLATLVFGFSGSSDFAALLLVSNNSELEACEFLQFSSGITVLVMWRSLEMNSLQIVISF